MMANRLEARKFVNSMQKPKIIDRDGSVSKDHLLTLAEVAKELRLSKSAVQRLVHGEVKNCPALPSIHIGSRILVRRESLQRFIRAIEQGTQSAA
jgi:excisionase family DNA binding protein